MLTRLAVLFLASCATAGGADLATAVVNTAVAGSVAAARRANGECYTPCTPGTACNATTGTCDPLPCRGECVMGERCEVTGLGEKCVPEAAALEPVLSVRTVGRASPVDAGVTDSPQRLQLPR